MRALIATHDYCESKARLMPWRVLLEVAEELRRASWEVSLVSLDSSQPASGEPASPGLRRVCKDRRRLPGELAHIVSETGADLLYWPLSWREPAWRTAMLTDLPVARVAYFPGGIFGLRAAFYALHRLGLGVARPYLLDSIVPRRRLVKNMTGAGFFAAITMTEATARGLTGAGWPRERVIVIPPGKDAPGDTKTRLPATFRSWLGAGSYFLFLGPPSGIRGTDELLDAFEIVAEQHPAARLVCLFRPDDELESETIRQRVMNSKQVSRIYMEWDMQSRQNLTAFIANARAVVLPFVLVPSEIPLAVIEAMGLSRPVITTSPGGTGELVARFGAAARTGDVRALAGAMLRMLQDENEWIGMTQRARALFTAHPDWRSVGGQWRSVGMEAVKRDR